MPAERLTKTEYPFHSCDTISRYIKILSPPERIQRGSSNPKFTDVTRREGIGMMGDYVRILVVDDEEGLRKSLKRLLEDEGYTVDTAEKGQEAIEQTESKYYNLALIDIRLPDMEGTRLFNAMNDTIPKMIKIVITGYPSLDNAVQAVNEGADAYIMKPLDPPSLLQKIEEQLQKQKEEQEYSQDKVADFIESRVREIKKEKE